MSLADNVKDIALSSAYPTDKVFYSESISVVLGDSVGFKFATGGLWGPDDGGGYQGPCDDTYFVTGIYSFDNGATWHDLNNASSFTSGELFPSFRLDAKAEGPQGLGAAGYIQYQGYQSALLNGGADWTLLIKAVGIAKKNQGQVNTPIVTSNPNLAAYQTDGVYAKIVDGFDDSFAISAGAGAQTRTINHGLKYVPDVRVYYEDVQAGITYMHELINTGGLEVKVNENDLVFIIPNLGSDRTFYYRIYYDE